jgi:L-fuculose-phosphate aldolase
MRMDEKSRERLAAEFARTGRALFEGGLNNSHSGNLSVRLDDRLVITRRGAMLGELASGDLVSVSLRESDGSTEAASTEFKVHRAIYEATDAQAVVHSHPRTATALSLLGRDIVPVDLEGRFYFRRVPVIDSREPAGSEELGRELSLWLRDFPIIVVRGHGAFAVGRSLEEGLRFSHTLEWSSDIISRCIGIGVPLDELLKKMEHGED